MTAGSRDRPVAIGVWTAIGCLLLSLAAITLVAVGIAGTVEHAPLPVTLGLVGGLFAVLVAIVAEWRFLRTLVIRARWEHSSTRPSRERPDQLIGRLADRPGAREDGAIAVAIVAGAIVTYGLAVEGEVSVVLGASLVGVGAGLLFPHRAVPAYCGAFVGMTSPAVLGSYASTAAAAVAASMLFLVARPVYQGVGGKLGTTAFVGVVSITLLASSETPTTMIPDPTTAAMALAVGGLAAAATFLLHVRLTGDTVLASGLVGVAAAIGLPFLPVGDGAFLAATAFGASFAGMTDTGRISHTRWVAVAGLLVGVLVVATAPFLAGTGGKLGTIAFAASLAVHATLRTSERTRRDLLREVRYRRDTT
ncbi:hypothetical protein [Halorubrum vacuolatum]|uniref:Uncharacterized protein n=1 Tax=Halorubrum vacuolatum TaxID=63740 RepID=A0A238UW33_HALVU|nr:hypothetical protein [Halorubrum vacuolatum]SNR26091.1 hypothetical protein SAMN06264855_101443 [Halorubrum vacuolatum]